MRRLAPAAIALATLALTAIPAHAGFAPPDPIATLPGIITYSSATDSQGNTFVVWEYYATGPTGNAVQGRWVSATDSVGPVLDISVPGNQSYQPQVAIAPNGKAFVAWRESVPTSSNSSAKSRWINPDSSMGPIATIATGAPNLDTPYLAATVAPNNIATVAWNNQPNTSTLMARRIDQDNILGPQFDNLDTNLYGLKLGSLPDGSTIIAYRKDSVGVRRLMIAANGAISSPLTISTDNNPADPNVATDPQGNSLITWTGFTTVGSLFAANARKIDSAGNPIGGVIPVSPNSTNSILSDVVVRTDSSGNFLIAWTRQNSGGNGVAAARKLMADGSFADPEQPLSPDADNATQAFPALFDQGGTGAVAWPDMTATLTRGISLGSSGAPVGGLATLLNGGSFVNASSNAAAGVGSFLSRASGATNHTLALNRYLVPPGCSDSSATVVQGKPINAPISCTGPGIEGANVVGKPAHGTAGPFQPGPALRYTPTPGFEGSDSFTYQATNDGGSSNTAKVTIKVGKDTVAPTIDRFRFVKTTSAAQASAKKKKKRKKTGYEFRLNFSEPATAKVTVERPARGVKKGKKCRARKRGAKGKRCTLYRSLGSVGSKQLATSSTVKLSAKLVKRIRRKGAMRAGAVATDAAGNKSKVKRLTIKIRR